jgi:hypothetical protein
MPYRYQHWQPCVSRDPDSASPAPGWTTFLLRPDLSLLIIVSRPKKGRTQSTNYQARYYLLSCKHISDLLQWNHDKSSAATYPMMSKSVQCRILSRIQDQLGIGTEKFNDHWDRTFSEAAHRPNIIGRYPVWSCSDRHWKGPVQGGGTWRLLSGSQVSDSDQADLRYSVYLHANPKFASTVFSSQEHFIGCTRSANFKGSEACSHNDDYSTTTPSFTRFISTKEDDPYALSLTSCVGDNSRTAVIIGGGGYHLVASSNNSVLNWNDSSYQAPGSVSAVGTLRSLTDILCND